MLGREEKISTGRLTSVQYAILVLFLVLGYGLWRLQVSQTNYYATQAENNRVRKVPILAPRGKIVDREGRIIVDNYPSFTALMMRDSARDMAGDAPLIAQGLHLKESEVRDKIRRFAGMPQYAPIYLKEDITPDELAFVESHRNELPELDTIMAHRRLYPRNGFLAHLVGYVGEVSEDMLSLPQWELYNPGDVVGKSGVELHITITDGKERLPASRREQQGQGDSGTRRNSCRTRQAAEADRRSRCASRCRGSVGRKNGAIVAWTRAPARFWRW